MAKDDIDVSQEVNFLGDYGVVDGLLRALIANVFTKEHASETELASLADKSSRETAQILLGQSPQFPGPAWNSPGQIDVWLAEREGIDSADPEERVSGALIQMLAELVEISNAAAEGKLVDEQWKWQVDEVIQRYVRLVMGMPESGLGGGES